MSGADNIVLDITPELLLDLYRRGIFPMAESADDPGLLWVEPRHRGVLQLHRFKAPRRLRRTVRQGRFEVTIDRDFAAVIEGCAGCVPDRPTTWINDAIRQLYSELFDRGICHTVEVRLDGELVGGLYGVAIAGVFFGESMFSRQRDASKVAMVHLCARLIGGAFKLLDTQFVTDHLKQFGVREVPRQNFLRLLESALKVKEGDGAKEANFNRLPATMTGFEALAVIDRVAGASSSGS